MTVCAYCSKKRGHQTDHLITANQARRSISAARMRDDPAFKVPACRDCNEAKGSRTRVPPSHAHLIPELEKITGSAYAVWDGTPEGLRAVVVR